MDTIKNSKVLIVGGAGFLGFHLIKKMSLCSNKITSISLHKPIGTRKIKGVKYLLFDIKNFNNIKNNLSKNFDYIINMSGYVDHSLFSLKETKIMDSHFFGLMNLVKFFIHSKKLKKFVNIGSSDEYGLNLSPQDENLREMPFSLYSFAKTSSTHFLQMLHKSENFPAVICRIFLSYGPFQDKNRLLPQVILGCLKDKEFPVSSGDQIRDFCYIDDIIDAIILILKSKNIDGEVFNIGGGKPIQIKNLINKINKIIGKGKPLFGKIKMRKNENISLYANIKKIKKHINWIPKTNLDTGLKSTIKYYSKIN